MGVTFDRESVFFLACREALRDGRLPPDEARMLKALHRELGLSEADGLKAFRRAKAALAGAAPAPGGFDPARVYGLALALLGASLPTGSPPTHLDEEWLETLRRRTRLDPARARALRAEIRPDPEPWMTGPDPGPEADRPLRFDEVFAAPDEPGPEPAGPAGPAGPAREAGRAIAPQVPPGPVGPYGEPAAWSLLRVFDVACRIFTSNPLLWLQLAGASVLASHLVGLAGSASPFPGLAGLGALLLLQPWLLAMVSSAGAGLVRGEPAPPLPALVDRTGDRIVDALVLWVGLCLVPAALALALAGATMLATLVSFGLLTLPAMILGGIASGLCYLAVGLLASFAFPALVLDRQGPATALATSARLVVSSPLDVLAALVFDALLAFPWMVAVGLAGFLAQAAAMAALFLLTWSPQLTAWLGKPLAFVVQVGAVELPGTLLGHFAALLFTLLYLRERVRLPAGSAPAQLPPG